MRAFVIRNSKFIIQLTLSVIALLFIRCEDFVTIPGSDLEINRADVFSDDATALSAMAGIYGQLSQPASFASGGNNSITYLYALAADELSTSSPSGASSTVEFYTNSITVNNNEVYVIWQNAYNVIYACNAVLEGLAGATGVTPSLIDQLKGEALFIRAFTNFYLVNLYGDVPLILTSDYLQNTTASRTPAATVYDQIIEDLEAAKSLMPDAYPSAVRARPNRYAAAALLARVHLYQESWAEAEAEAAEVIGNTSMYGLVDSLNIVFRDGSREAIWQLLTGGGLTSRTYEAEIFIQSEPPASKALRNGLVTSVEPGDDRKTFWIDSVVSTSGFTTWFFPFKYKDGYSYTAATARESSMVFRVAEQYLIRAEARAMQGKFSEASDDINVIRARANLEPGTWNDEAALLLAVEKERRVELFTEWGHRFFDLRRWGKLDAVLDPAKPGWESHDQWLPIPQAEILLNKNLEQNDGF